MMTAPTILALHGNLGSPRDWQSLGIAGLEALDLWERSGESFAEAASWIAERAGTARPILAGYSLGGRLALAALAAYPERFSGGVIVSAHPGLACVEDRLARRTSDEIWARRAREMDWDAFLDHWDDQEVLAGPRPLPDRSGLEARREALARGWENWSLGRQEDLRQTVAASGVPICWVTGARDGKFTALGREMAGRADGIELRVIPDCGHRVIFEKPGELAGIVTAFRERVVRESSVWKRVK